MPSTLPICSLDTILALSFVLCLNVAFFIANLCFRLCSKPPSDTLKRSVTVQRFQSFISQRLHHTITPSSSFVPPSTIHQSSLPDFVTCVAVVPHRKMFLGKISWGGGTEQGFLKECLNPFEMILHQQLDHENVVRFEWSNLAERPTILLSPGVTSPFPLPISFYTMELCSRGNLHDLLLERGHEFTEAEVSALLRDTAAGLEYLHGRCIAHRDLKTENVMVQSRTCSIVGKIGDFDHAVDESAFSQPGLAHSKAFGTALYLAPEIALGSPPFTLSQFQAHDIYSFGLLVWECTTWLRCRNSLAKRGSAAVPLIPSTQQRSTDHTNDLAQMRSRVACSTCTHVPLIRELCRVMGLKYNKTGKSILREGMLLSRDRPINAEMIESLYTREPGSRPVLFPAADPWTRVVNGLMAECWAEGEERSGVAEVVEKTRELLARCDEDYLSSY